MTHHRTRLAPWNLLPFAALALGGCTVAVAPGPAPPPAMAVADDGTVYPTVPPPDPIPEIAPPAPGYGYVWINGYWDWSGADWMWYSGYWVPRAEASLYVAPRFVFIEGRPVYYRGYWQGDGGRRVYGYGWRGAPPPAYRARPQVAPQTWRAEHNQGWRASPGASAWRGNAAPAAGGWRGNPAPAPAAGGAWRGNAAAPPAAGGAWRGNAAQPAHAEPVHPGPAQQPGHPGWGQPAPGAFHPGPTGPGGPHPGAAGAPPPAHHPSAPAPAPRRRK